MIDLLPLILVGFFVYLIFYGKGSGGCRCGHGQHETKRRQDAHSHDLAQENFEGPVIDLRKDEYRVISISYDHDRTENTNSKKI